LRLRFATRTYRKTADDHRKPLARYSAMESALRERLARVRLHHQPGHDPVTPGHHIPRGRCERVKSTRTGAPLLDRHPEGREPKLRPYDGRVEDAEMSKEQVERRLAAILAADVAGYSRLMGADEEGTLAALRAHRREFLDLKIAEHRGRIVKTTGDGLLIEFASVVDATRCAVGIQDGRQGAQCFRAAAP
jgi:hypothetical protein